MCVANEKVFAATAETIFLLILLADEITMGGMGACDRPFLKAVSESVVMYE